HRGRLFGRQRYAHARPDPRDEREPLTAAVGRPGRRAVEAQTRCGRDRQPYVDVREVDARKLLRRHADDREALIAELERRPEGLALTREMLLPESVADHGDGVRR